LETITAAASYPKGATLFVEGQKPAWLSLPELPVTGAADGRDQTATSVIAAMSVTRLLRLG